jgi:hypothetical protein
VTGPAQSDIIESRPLPEPLGVSGWLAFPPTLRQQDIPLLLRLIEDIDTLLRPYPIGEIYSSEPRFYGRTPRGRRALAASVRAGRVGSLIWTTPSRGPGGPGLTRITDAQCTLSLHSTIFPAAAGSIAIVIQPGKQAAYPGLVEQVMTFLTTWFDPLNAASAFVSHYGIIVRRGEVGDHAQITRYERTSSSGTVSGWGAVRRYVRGVFWGMGLGPDLCNQLGGPAAVLHNAPMSRAWPLGTGVWLQASDEPPGAEADLARLATYIQPLLGTAADIRQADAEDLACWHESHRTDSDDLAAIFEEAATIPHAPVPSSKPRQKRVPIRGLRALLDLEVGAALNGHLERPPTRPQLVRLVATMQAWYEEGFSGAFGGSGFHSLTGPTADARVIRWDADLGSADAELAVRALALRLASLPDVKVTRLVLGAPSTS